MIDMKNAEIGDTWIDASGINTVIAVNTNEDGEVINIESIGTSVPLIGDFND